MCFNLCLFCRTFGLLSTLIYSVDLNLYCRPLTNLLTFIQFVDLHIMSTCIHFSTLIYFVELFVFCPNLSRENGSCWFVGHEKKLSHSFLVLTRPVLDQFHDSSKSSLWSFQLISSKKAEKMCQRQWKYDKVCQKLNKCSGRAVQREGAGSMVLF